MDFNDLFKKDEDEYKLPEAVTPAPSTSSPNTSDTWQSLMDEYKTLSANRPQQNTGIDYGKLFAQALAGAGNSIALGAGAQAPNDVNAIGNSFDAMRQHKYQSALDAWKEQLGGVKNRADVLKQQETSKAAQRKAEAEAAYNTAKTEEAKQHGKYYQARADNMGKMTPYEQEQLKISNARLAAQTGHWGNMENLERDKFNQKNPPSVTPSDDTVPDNRVNQKLAGDILKPENKTSLMRDRDLIQQQMELYPKVAANQNGLHSMFSGAVDILSRNPEKPFSISAMQMMIDNFKVSPEERQFLRNETQHVYNSLKQQVGSSNISNADVAGLMNQRLSVLADQKTFDSEMQRRKQTNDEGIKTYNSYARQYAPNQLVGDIVKPSNDLIVDGYRFKGGNKNDPNNWEKVQ